MIYSSVNESFVGIWRMEPQLFTVGYEGATIGGFIHTLQANKIRCILDIRALPLSRKPGFSKNQLAQTLNREDIQYIHLAELGAPKQIRDRLKRTHDYTTFFRKMDSYLTGQKEAIEQAYNHAISIRCCLLCFERLVDKCHRKIVAEKIKATNGDGFQIIHI